MTKMTPEVIKAAAKKHGGYANPMLNDVLYLHCNGFGKIENLEPYKELKVLWLEQNGFEEIEGLDENKELITLFLQNNALTRISGLNNLSNLRILNLSHNYIRAFSNIAAYCPLLESLQLSHNRLERLEESAELQEMKFLSSVDLSYNALARPEGATDSYVYDFFSKMPALAVLYLQGQPLTSGVKTYRKNMIWHIKTLTYLDERPIFADERRTVEAWGGGGTEAESTEREAIRKEKRDHLTSCVQTMAEMAEKMKDVKEARSKEWEARREVERKFYQQQLAVLRGMRSDEEDARVIIETEEHGEWVDLVDVLGKALLVAEAEDEERHKERAEKEALERAAIEEIRKEEAALEALVKAADSASVTNGEKQKRREEVAFWVRQMEMSEEDIVTQMEDEMTEMLKMMRPTGGYKDIAGMAAAAVEAENADKQQGKEGSSTSPSKSAARSGASSRHVDPTSHIITNAAADDDKNNNNKGEEAAAVVCDKVEAASKVTATLRASKKFSKERVWAQYDAWESLQIGRKKL